ncbi:ras and ef-hand domain-containing protein [Anaeramoeba flamelloides]|uniref:Ras and ef-hand domain-containing protein n=1 Tax=Anaeramoeba flamelloides TaxID=1746091 RepID=A0AAV8A7G2_9EUKA|nr:ras and ef-hand domain-containing protein [Anaeramoeba flamelloides]|eukprot:Anaeramoba_flamelloidesa325254_63.p1 GENE.a325254_63~~a325254_63.p1  ORF type:complete len:210 (-),score=52.46 a325254_63:240-869(-)
MSDSEIEDYDYLVKLLMVGDSACGKTSILLRFSEDKYNKNMPSTIGVDFREKTKTISNNKKVKFSVWDTAGQERFRTLTSSYYRGAQGIILVYDVTRRETFENLEDWINEIDMYSSSDVKIMLIGNKIDLKEEEDITKEEGLEFARKHQMMFIQTSAKTKEGIIQAFDELAMQTIDSLSTSSSGKGVNYSINLTEQDEDNENEEGGWCC